MLNYEKKIPKTTKRYLIAMAIFFIIEYIINLPHGMVFAPITAIVITVILYFFIVVFKNDEKWVFIPKRRICLTVTSPHDPWHIKDALKASIDKGLYELYIFSDNYYIVFKDEKTALNFKLRYVPNTYC